MLFLHLFKLKSMVFIILSFKMGLSLSINQSSYQNVSNAISQISNEECINYVVEDSKRNRK